MGRDTKIEWADHTWNPWIGCMAVSPACADCYAEAWDARFAPKGQPRVAPHFGPHAPRRRTTAANWREPLRWNAEAAKAGTRPFVFGPSLADPFDNAVPQEWLRDYLALIEQTPHLVWLLLTKRIGNVPKMIKQGALPRNVAIGATMANQAEYDRDAEKLYRVRTIFGPLFTFGSFEPLLGEVRLNRAAPDWIIVGGKSGPNGAALDPALPRQLRDDAERLGRIFNFKQWGGTDKAKGGHLLDGQAYLARPEVPAYV